MGSRVGHADVPQDSGRVTRAVSPVSLSLQEEFLGRSHCCPILWIPHDNKVEKAGGWVAGTLGGLLFAVLLTAHGSSVFLHRSPQHGRIHAENEPSPRHGAHGAWPTGNQLPAYLSVCLPCHLCAPAFFPFSTVCQSPTFLALS